MSAAPVAVFEDLHVTESQAAAELLLTRAGPLVVQALTRGDGLARDALVELIACGFSVGRLRGQRDAGLAP